MSAYRIHNLIALSLLILLSSCSNLSQGETPEQEAPFPTADPTLMPIGDVTFIAAAPSGTPADAELAMVIMDEVSGWGNNDRVFKMEPLGDGRWQVKINPPAGTLLRYRYVRLKPSASEEARADGSPVAKRVTYIPTSGEYEDTILAWAGSTYQGPTGRVVGRLVEADTGTPLADMLVHIAGQVLYSDGTGAFRVDYLPPGEHRITAFSPDGAFLPAQQGAIIAAGSTTPAEMEMHRAQQIQVTFEITVPNDTLEGVPIRLAGNLAPLGHTFPTQPGSSSAVKQMPTFIEVDPTHYILIMNLYAGTDLRYKYSLGDGWWNGERDQEGQPLTRQTILPDEDIVVRDAVVSWRGDDVAPFQIWVTTPAETPAEEEISIQINNGAWSAPIPMWRLSQNEWFMMLYGPFDINQPLLYRYCRNLLCGKDLSLGTAAESPSDRRLDINNAGTAIQDKIDAWQWWTSAPVPPSVAPVELTPQEGFEVGVELMAVFQPAWEPYVLKGIQRAAEMGATNITLTPTWVIEQTNPTPSFRFNPDSGPNLETLGIMVEKAQTLGLEVGLRPELIFPLNDANSWWSAAERDDIWWELWFSHYRSFVLTYAKFAADHNVSKLILGGAAVNPSLPDGTLADGNPSNVPPNAALRWEGILNELRGYYQGTLAFELSIDGQLQPAPVFIDRFEEIHLHWRAPIAADGQASLAEMQISASAILDDILAAVGRSGKDLAIILEVPSVDGTATGCAPAEAGYCLPPAAFDLGAAGNPALSIDLDEQSLVIHAIFSEAYPRSEISGFYLRGFNPVLALRDKSASVRGKPAGELLQLWFSGITGAAGE